MSDRLEVQKNIWDYANAVDFLDFAIFDTLFLPGAKLRYGETDLTVAQAKKWLEDKLTVPPLKSYYHMMGSMWIKVRGDIAESLTRCFNPMEFAQPNGQASLWFNGIWYHWKHMRTSAGWRIAGSWDGPSGLPGGRVPGRPLDWYTPDFPADQQGPPLLPR
ncbi:MAG TPA: nuclear transport factor 2 family protein [Alphaproteobacteria bacterium]|nr:nuclear transport factor 2 family protein [Alphaproteobacteria bacterium]